MTQGLRKSEASILHSTLAKDHFHHLCSTVGEESTVTQQRLLRARRKGWYCCTSIFGYSISLPCWWSPPKEPLLSACVLCDFAGEDGRRGNIPAGGGCSPLCETRSACCLQFLLLAGWGWGGREWWNVLSGFI